MHSFSSSLRHFVTAVLLLASWSAAQTRSTHTPPRSTAAAPAPAVPSLKDEAPTFVDRKLANGLQIIVYEDHSVPLVTVEFVARAGSSVESPGQSGFSHLFEHMVFKRNRATVEGEEYMKNIGQLGITYNGETREETCNEYFTALSQHLPVVVRLLRDAVRYPTLDPEEFDREKQVVLAELDRMRSNPYSAVNVAMNEHLYRQNALRKEPAGNEDTVRRATREQLRAFEATYWVPNNSAVVISGDVKPEDAFKLVEQFFGDWPRVATDPLKANPPPAITPLTRNEGAVITSPISSVIVEVGWLGPSVGQDTAATYAADVFSFILRQPNSRFQRALVDSGATTGANLGYYTQRFTGPINAIIRTDPEHVRAALRTFWEQAAHFTDADYFTDQELENAKTLLGAEELYSRENPDDYSHTLGFWWAVADVDYFRGYQRNLAAVTRADIRRYLQTYLLGKPHVSLVMLSDDAQQKLKLKPEELVGP
jgi:zinc protease